MNKKNKKILYNIDKIYKIISIKTVNKNNKLKQKVYNLLIFQTTKIYRKRENQNLILKI